MRTLHVAPSLLSADCARLGEEIQAIAPFSDRIHLDVMDGHFVPNITFGPYVIRALRPYTTLPFDVHLMISPVDPFLEAFAKAGADVIIFHPEATPDPMATLEKIKALGCKTGIALSPGVSLLVLEVLLPLVDLVLVMTVRPGFGGQAFMEEQLDVIRGVRVMIDQGGRSIVLEVDGGISPQTVGFAFEAGADVVVAGNAIFQGGVEAYERNIQALRSRSQEFPDPTSDF